MLARVLAVAVLSSASLSASLAAETVTVGGAPAVLLRPSSPPRGSIILLAGGDGNLGIGAGGSITRLGGNQLVRTRGQYAARGFAVLVPEGHVHVPSAVEFMAKIKRPVALVGTSRGTQRAARGIAAGARPDALVLTSGFLSPQSGEGVNVHVVGVLGSPASLPRTLVVHHRRDGCRLTLPAGVQPFVSWAQGKARVVWLDGGVDVGDPCQARGYHGFAGLDAQVVSTVSRFIAGE